MITTWTPFRWVERRRHDELNVLLRIHSYSKLILCVERLCILYSAVFTVHIHSCLSVDSYL